MATESTSVKMEDGSTVEFAGKSKIKKSALTAPNGDLALRIDFINGKVRIYPLNPELVTDYALHGASQKFGDEVAGMKGEGGAAVDIDDMVQALDELHQRVNVEGKWKAEREGGAGPVAGGSVLAKAVAEVTGQTADVVKAFLAGLSPKEKTALRNDPKVRPVVKRIEEEKLARQAPSEVGSGLLAKLAAA